MQTFVSRCQSCPVSLIAVTVLLTMFASPRVHIVQAGDAKYPRLPEPISSFGAAVQGNWLYVYSGHTGTAHAHSKRNLSQRFLRLNLDAPQAWESLSMGPGLQSPALVAHGKAVYRIGGLSARNEPNEEADLESVTDFTRFDPADNKWTSLEPLPEGRSSHDAVVVGDRVYVVGGWNLGKEKKWHSSALVLNLADAQPKWTELPAQPFQRRALAVAELNGNLYAIGGMTEEGPSLDVHQFDLKTNQWSAGPVVPGQNMNGFGCSACVLNGRLYITTMDGQLHRLARDGKSWESAGKLQMARFFHRLLPYGSGQLLAVAGASHTSGHLDSIEQIVVGGAE